MNTLAYSSASTEFESMNLDLDATPDQVISSCESSTGDSGWKINKDVTVGKKRMVDLSLGDDTMTVFIGFSSEKSCIKFAIANGLEDEFSFMESKLSKRLPTIQQVQEAKEKYTSDPYSVTVQDDQGGDVKDEETCRKVLEEAGFTLQQWDEFDVLAGLTKATEAKLLREGSFEHEVTVDGKDYTISAEMP
jgi:hypothetical protein